MLSGGNEQSLETALSSSRVSDVLTHSFLLLIFSHLVV